MLFTNVRLSPITLEPPVKPAVTVLLTPTARAGREEVAPLVNRELISLLNPGLLSLGVASTDVAV